ncbi:MAG TPA: hypothetical protein QGF58_23825, partial [Myxococcota bacterium]|nr:hypothetical protein [Myxococcota bacterium]
IENDEIYWVTVLYSLGTAVDQEDVTRWHDTFPHHKIIVLGDGDLQLQSYLSVRAMPRIDVLDEDMNLLVYELAGPRTGMRHLVGLPP